MSNELNERTNDIDTLSFSEDSLQRYLKIKRSNFFKRLAVLVVLWGLIVGYFVSPLSKVGTPTIEGNYYLSSEEIRNISQIDSSKHLWKNDTKNQINLLESHPLIKNVEITVNIFGVHIEIEETYPIAKVQSSSTGSSIADFNYYLSDSSLVLGEAVFQSKPLSNAINSVERLPILTNIDDNEILEKILKQLSDIELNIIGKIKEVSYADNYLASDEIDVIKLVLDKSYFNLDSDLILYLDLNRMSYKVSKSHLDIIAKYIKPSAKLDNSYYCLSYIGNKTASCKESIK